MKLVPTCRMHKLSKTDRPELGKSQAKLLSTAANVELKSNFYATVLLH